MSVGKIARENKVERKSCKVVRQKENMAERKSCKVIREKENMTERKSCQVIRRRIWQREKRVPGYQIEKEYNRGKIR